MPYVPLNKSVEAEQFSLTREWPEGVIEVNPIFKLRQFSYGTKEHHVHITPGDWIVTDSTNQHKYVMPDHLFRRTYTYV